MKLLVATDGSKPSLNAVKYAIKLLARIGSEPHSVTLISVHDEAALRHARAFVGPQTVTDYLREQCEKDLKPARKLLDQAGLRHDMVMRTGHVAKEIVACADSGRFDMLLLGAKGRGPVSDLLMGSVAQRVLAAAKTPVLLVK